MDVYSNVVEAVVVVKVVKEEDQTEVKAEEKIRKRVNIVSNTRDNIYGKNAHVIGTVLHTK